MPIKTIINPGQVNAGLKIIKRVQNDSAIKIYNAGKTGYPKAL